MIEVQVQRLSTYFYCHMQLTLGSRVSCSRNRLPKVSWGLRFTWPPSYWNTKVTTPKPISGL